MATADVMSAVNADVPVEHIASADAAAAVNTDVVIMIAQPVWGDIHLESGGPESGFCAKDDAAGAISDAETSVLCSHKTIRSLRRREALWIGLVVFLVCGMFCTTLIAVHVTKEMHVQDSRLVDSAGSPVFTRTQVDAIEGVEIPEGRRRLSGDSNLTFAAADAAAAEQELAKEGAMEINLRFFERTQRAYSKGQTEWVVKLPDDTARTVHIQGASRWKAWGKCGDCQGNMRWVVSCQNNEVNCSIAWWRTEEGAMSSSRRLPGAEDTEAALLARAGAKAPKIAYGEDDEEEAGTRSMERSLGGKQCA